MPVIAENLSPDEIARLGVIAEPEPVPPPSRREVTAKRSALMDRDGSYTWDGERCSPCADCGLIFTASGLRLRRGVCERMLCRRCLALAKKGEPHG